MRFLNRAVAAAAILSGMSAVVAAQPPGGFGMFGGFAGGVHGMVANTKALQDELKVTAEQKDKLTDALKPIQEKRRELFQGFTPGQQPTEEEQKELREKMSKLNDETRKAVEGILKLEQTKRLTQINYQAMGVRAFTDKDAQAALNMTEKQKQKAKAVVDEFVKESRELFQDAIRDLQGGDPDSFQKKLPEVQKKTQDLQKKAEGGIEKELTDEQKKAWKELLGEKFDLDKLQPRPIRRNN
jgi:Spy/CpxP family protein refolding chaperone